MRKWANGKRNKESEMYRQRRQNKREKERDNLLIREALPVNISSFRPSGPLSSLPGLASPEGLSRKRTTSRQNKIRKPKIDVEDSKRPSTWPLQRQRHPLELFSARPHSLGLSCAKHITRFFCTKSPSHDPFPTKEPGADASQHIYR